MMEVWLQFAGRLHPLLLHLPIGAIVALVAFEIFGGRSAARAQQGRVRFLLCALVTVGALASAASGWLLSEEFGNSGDTFWWHRALGLGFALSVTLASLAALIDRERAYLAFLFVAVVLIVPAGHYGAQLTHGMDFLTEPFEGEAEEVLDAEEPAPGILPVASGYESVIAPILESRCGRCHGSEKQKAGLALNDPGHLMLAGESGAPPIVPGDPEGSEILRRMLLPGDEDGHMPPSSKPQPTVGEIQTLERWIALGAPLEGPLPLDALAADPESDVPAAASGDASQPVEEETGPSADREVPPLVITEESLRDLRAEHIHVEVIDPVQSLLWIDFGARPATDDAFLARHLAPLRDAIAELSLARTAVTDAGLEQLVEMPNLERLDLTDTAITSRGIAGLEAHPKLAWLNLTRTQADDDARVTLEGLPALRSVHLWRSGVTPEGVELLRKARPSVDVVTGGHPPLEPTAVEPPVVFGGADDHLPVNAECPVTGSPLDPKVRIVHEKRVIGFCCTDCPGKFWTEPELYPID